MLYFLEIICAMFMLELFIACSVIMWICVWNFLPVRLKDWFKKLSGETKSPEPDWIQESMDILNMEDKDYDREAI